tara:strand:+ start:476 stop:856 length:381 start_codon:yes stop_codon:yes gene_type:complete
MKIKQTKKSTRYHLPVHGKGYAGGGEVPLPEADPRSVRDAQGNPLSGDFREVASKQYWIDKANADRQSAADDAVVGTANRSVGEHLLAGVRALSDGDRYSRTKMQAKYMDAGRDPKNPLYDKRKGK